MASLLLGNVINEKSVLVNEVFVVYRNEDVMLLVVDTRTKYPDIEGVMGNTMLLNVNERSVSVGEIDGYTEVKLGSPPGFEIWSCDTGRYNVNVTMRRREE